MMERNRNREKKKKKRDFGGRRVLIYEKYERDRGKDVY